MRPCSRVSARTSPGGSLRSRFQPAQTVTTLFGSASGSRARPRLLVPRGALSREHERRQAASALCTPMGAGRTPWRRRLRRGVRRHFGELHTRGRQVLSLIHISSAQYLRAWIARWKPCSSRYQRLSHWASSRRSRVGSTHQGTGCPLTRASSVLTHANSHLRGAWRCWANTSGQLRLHVALPGR